MNFKTGAFTLIELLVVIAIVGILTGFIFVSMNGAVNSAKDAKRKADLANLEKAILAYNAQNNSYPSTDTYPCTIGTGGTCTNLASNLAPYMNTLPIGPDNDRYTYNYNSGSFTLSGTLSSGPWAYNSSTGVWGNGYTLGQYKIQITIPAAAGASANYPVKLILTTTNVPNLVSHMASDFHDLRFTDSTGTNQIPFWIESYTASTTATVWVQVPSISSGATIYMYYGTQATTASNGENTFSFFDDFPGTSLDTTNKWSMVAGTCSISGGINSMVPSSGYNIWPRSQSQTFGAGYAIRTNAQMVGAYCYILFANSDNSKNSGLQINVNSPNNVAYYTSGMGGSNSMNVGVVSNAYHKWDIMRLSNSIKIYLDDSLQGTGISIADTSQMGISVLAERDAAPNSGTVYLDWILVRPYVSTEPANANLTYGSETTGQ